MKRNIIFLSIYIGLLSLTACKKNNLPVTGLTSLNIINAAETVPRAAVNLYSTITSYYQNNNFITYQTSEEKGLPFGTNSLSIVSSSDTTGNIFHGTIDLKYGGIYSLYIEGPANNVQALLLKDTIPYYAADSVAGARFINLSPDSQPLSVNLQGSSQTEFTNLAYKKITAFKQYSATSAVTNNGGYNYEIRDASGNLLTTFNWSPTVFKNNTLVISGQVSDGSISVFPVNNF